MHPGEVKYAVQKVMQESQKENPFKNGRPGKKWFILFMAKNILISKRTAEIISKTRASVTERNLQSLVEKYGHIPQRR